MDHALHARVNRASRQHTTAKGKYERLQHAQVWAEQPARRTMMVYSSLPQDVVLCDGAVLATSCLLLSWARLRLSENSVSPPSNQHLASGAGKFSQRIQSLASLSACPLMHFAYMICSFRFGSPGLTLGEAIFGIKNLHQGTVVYLPCSRLRLFCLFL